MNVFRLSSTIVIGVICCWAATTNVLADTHVEGCVFGVWPASGNPYIVDNDLYVPDNKTLTIRAGVDVYFIGNDSLTVYGGLFVEGDAHDSVHFIPDIENSNGWKGIFFKAGAWNNSYIEYAVLKESFIGISIISCDAWVSHTYIQAQSRGLVLMYAHGEYTDNDIHTSFLTSTGIYMRKSNAKLLRNVIDVNGTNFIYNSFGIDVNRCNYAELKENNIRVQGLGGTFGILFDNCDHIEITYNVVEAFSDYISYGIFMVDSHQPVVRNNTVITVAASIDRGIYCVNAPAYLTNNIIVGDGSSVGIYCENMHPVNSYNDIWNQSTSYEGCMAGEGDISADPLFVGGTPYSYHLLIESPCINTGNPIFYDPDGTRSDMGAYYYNFLSAPPSPDITAPDHHWLGANYPNPFNPETTIPFALSHQTKVTLDVFNILGKHVVTLWEGELAAGRHQIRWVSDNNPSGVYFYRLNTGDRQLDRKMFLLK